MKEFLLTSAIVLLIATSAHDIGHGGSVAHAEAGVDPNRVHHNHQCVAPDGETSITCPNEPIGWMKTPDVGCQYTDDHKDYLCNAEDHYTDEYQRGGLCATFGVPFYDRPNGRPIGLLWGEEPIHAGEKSKDGKWTRIWSLEGQGKREGIMPYSEKAMRGCG